MYILPNKHAEVTKKLNCEQKLVSEHLEEKEKLMLLITEISKPIADDMLSIESNFFEKEGLKENVSNESPNSDKKDNYSQTIESEMQDFSNGYGNLERQLIACTQKVADNEALLYGMEIERNDLFHDLVEGLIEDCKSLQPTTITKNELCNEVQFSNSLIVIAQDLSKYVEELKILYVPRYENSKKISQLIRTISAVNLLVLNFQLQCKNLCLAGNDAERCKDIIVSLTEVSQNVTNIFDNVQKFPNVEIVSSTIDSALEKLERLTATINAFTINGNKPKSLEELVEHEMFYMDEAINEAVAKISEMLSQAKGRDNGKKLKVNENILDACTHLMETIKILIQKSKILQAEIVSLDKSQATRKEFYKKNSLWTEGLISASKSIAAGAKFLVAAADKAVSGHSSDNMDLIVAAHDIAACTAQLVVASRVKAPPESKKLDNLIAASRNVSLAIAGIVATVKESDHDAENSSDDFDFSSLNTHQSKTKEMEIQINILHLEHSLEVARARLSALRKHNYHNIEE